MPFGIVQVSVPASSFEQSFACVTRWGCARCGIKLSITMVAIETAIIMLLCLEESPIKTFFYARYIVIVHLIYIITNTKNSKVYIGQTRQTLKQRWSKHVWDNKCKYLSNAISKYGTENFSILLLTVAGTQETADYWEKHFIAHYQSNKREKGYNIREGGFTGNSFGPEFRLATSKRLRGSGNHNAKLNEHDAIAIRKDPRALQAIADDYNVSRRCVQMIKENKSWKHLTEPIVRVSHHRGCRTLTVEQQKAIAKDIRSSVAIASEYGVSPNTINRLKRSFSV